MRFNTLVSIAVLASSTLAKDVDCVVGSTVVATVDLASGVCPFEIPDKYPVQFDYTSPEDYEAEFYYSEVDGKKYFNDIENAGTTIDIPAKVLYGKDSAPLFQVQDDKSPASNSTEALRRRLLGKTVYARDEESDLIAALKELEGTAVDGSDFSVVDPSDASASGDITSTVTEEHTTLVTITSCVENKCHLTAVPAVETLTTVTVEGVVTSYTTYCPLTAEEESSTLSTVTTTVNGVETIYTTYCPLTAEAAEASTEASSASTVTTTVNGVETIYTTYCPVTASEAAEAAESEDVTSTIYVTSYVTLAESTESVVTTTVNGVETIYTTVCPVTAAVTSAEVVPATGAPATTAAALSSVAKFPVSNSTTLAKISSVSNSTALAPIANSTTLAPVAVTSGDSEITSTIEQTVTVSNSAAETSEAAVSTVEGAANKVGFTSLVALVFAGVAYLI